MFGIANDTNDIVLDIYSSRGLALAQNIVAKQRDGKIYLDLLVLSSALGGVIMWNGEIAEGWLRAENDHLKIDLGAERMDHRGVISQLSPIDAFTEDGMLCVSTDIIAALYGVQFNIELSRLRATIDGPPTAAERRMLRARNQSQISNGISSAMHRDADFATYDAPALNRIRVVTSSRFRRRDGRNNASLETATIFTDARFDAFNSRMKIITNATKGKGTTNLRVSSQRVNPGQSSYTESNIGDVTSWPVVNGGPPSQGIGFRITNKPLHHPSIVGEEVISGDAPPGREVELYQDDSLIDVTFVDASGRYEFPAASLRSGKNKFTIKIHGKEGQLQTVERNVFANHGVPAKGTLRYAVSAQRDDKTLTGNRERYVRKTNSAAYRERKSMRVMSDFRYAITNETALTGGLSQVPTETGDEHLSTVGVRSNFFGRMYTLDFTRASGSATGTAMRAYSRLLFGPVSGGITYQYYDDYSAGAAKYGASYRRNNLNSNLNLPFRNLGSDNKTSVHTRIEYNRLVIRDGRRFETLTPRISWNRSGTNISTSFSLTRNTNQRNIRTHHSAAALSATRYMGNDQISVNLQQALQPSVRITSYSIRYQKHHSSKMKSTLRLSHYPNTDKTQKKETKLNWGMTLEQNRYKLGAAVEVNSKGGMP